MTTTTNAEAKELDLVGKVELRIALTDSDIKLESLLRTYLPPLLLKLASEYVNVRNKTKILRATSIFILGSAGDHASTRPTDAADFLQDRLKLLPTLINGMKRNFGESARHTSTLFNMLLKLLHALTLPARGSAEDVNLRQKLGLTESLEDAEFIASWFGKLLLFLPNQSAQRLPGLSIEDCSFLQLYDRKDTWQPGTVGGMNLVDTKVVAVKFLASGAFTDTERFLPALLAAADPNSRVSDIGEDMLKRAIPAVSLEDTEILGPMFRLYLGTRGTDGSLPALPPLQIKVLTLLSRSKRASSYRTENIKIIHEGLTSDARADLTSPIAASKGLEASKLRTHIFAYTNWLARVSESSDIDMVAPTLVSQLREYIERQGWPTYHAQATGPNAQVSNLRSLGYESIGILARASPATLILDENLDLLRWLFDSLAADSAGRDVSLSIEHALSSVLGAFGGELNRGFEEALEGLLSHNMERQPGDVEGVEFKIVRSTRFVAIRFANRCLPFRNTKARWMNILAIGSNGNERKETFEEGKRGLDPYWYRLLNPSTLSLTNGAQAKDAKYDLPLVSDLAVQFFGSDSIWNTARPPGLSLPMENAYSQAVRFCRNMLVGEALSTNALAINGEWEQQLDSLIVNDEHTRQQLRSHLHAMTGEDGTRIALDKLFAAAFNGVVAPESKCVAACGEILLQLCPLAPNTSVADLSEKAHLLKDAIVSNDRSSREASSHLFGILGSHPHCPQVSLQKMMRDFSNRAEAWQEAVGSVYFQAHGAILANAYYWSRRAFRADTPPTPEDEVRIQRTIDLVLDILKTAQDKTLQDAASTAFSELSLSGIMSPRSLKPPQSASEMISKLSNIAEKGNENAVKALGAFGMQCEEELEGESLLHQITTCLFKLHEVKEPTMQFSVGEALSHVAVGWQSKSLMAALDVQSPVPFAPSRSSSLEWTLQKIIEDCKTTKPALRQASVIWLLCLVQFCGHLQSVRDRLRDCQSAFKGFLADRDSLNQETASRGLSLVYEKGDRELKDDLVRDLVSSFTGTSANMSGRVSGETQLFEPGALPTGEGSITTYKDIMSLAAEVGNPSLVYKFMSLAANNAVWTSRAALGRFGLSNIFSDSSVDGYLAQNPKLYPALFRYRFDPNTNVRNSMNEIWTALVREPTATIDQHFDNIMGDLLKNILGKEWRTRQACCGAIADLVQSRPAAKYEKYIGDIWTLTFKVCDDIKESVRTAAMALARVLVGLLTRGLEAGDSSTRSAGVMLKNVLPFLLSPSGLESAAEDVQAFSLSALMQIIKKSSKDSLRPFVPDLVGRLILLLSSLEPQGIEYVRLRAEQYGVTGQQIDDARLSGVRGSPMLEAIERCLDFLDAAIMEDLRRPLENAIASGLGLPSRVGGSRVLVSLSTKHNFVFRPHASHFLKLARKQVLDRNETISASYSAACGYLSRLASDDDILGLVKHCRKLYFDSDEDRHRVVAGDIVLAVSKYATDRFNALAADFLPFIFFAKHDSHEPARTLFHGTWNETVGGSRTVLLYMQEIVQLAVQYLDSPRWSLKHTAAFSIAEAVNATGEDINDSVAQTIWPGLEKAVDGKTWEGKERVLQAFVRFCRAPNIITQDEPKWSVIQVSYDTFCGVQKWALSG
ncbi:MAG: hypothetical protein Q9174_000685 [Haloplaca sp. 1 TL-2023]